MKIRIMDSKSVALESQTEHEAKLLMKLLNGVELQTLLIEESVKPSEASAKSDGKTSSQVKSKTTKRKRRVGYSRTCPVEGCNARVKGASGIGIHLRKSHGISPDGVQHDTFSHRGNEFPVSAPVVATTKESNHPQLPIGYKVVKLEEKPEVPTKRTWFDSNKIHD